MFKRALSLWAIIALCGVVPGCRDAPDKKAHAYDQELLKHSIYFIAPAGWQRVSSKESSAVVFSRKEDQKCRITVLSPKIIHKEAFQVYLSIKRGLLQKPIVENRIILCGVPCYEFTYLQTNKEGLELKIKSYELFKNGKAYGISYASAPQDFGANLAEFEKSIATYKIK